MAFYHKDSGNDTTYVYGKPSVESSSTYSMAKIYLYMFGGLLITAAVAAIVGVIFTNLLSSGVDNVTDGALIAYMVMMITSAIALIVMSFVINSRFMRAKKSLMVPMIIYCVLMGFMLSTFTLVFQWWFLASVFGITALVFAALAGLSMVIKPSRGGTIMTVALGLLIGGSIMSLYCWLLSWLMPAGVSLTMYYIVSFALLAFILLVTLFDMMRIKSIAQGGAMTNNMSLYLAFMIYVDFIYILIRILRIAVMFSSNRN